MQRPGHLFTLLIWFALPFLVLARDNPHADGSPGPQSAASPSTTQSSTADAPKSCDAPSLLFNFDDYRDGEPPREVPIWRVGDSSAFFFAAGMTIDADGAPNAYNPENTGLDDLSNAGSPGHWDGVLQDENGDPLVQGSGDPFPGYYISCTALADRTKQPLDPTRFVDASRIPYIVLPRDVARETGAWLGDFAVVMNARSGKFSYAIFADVGTLGEGSIALADNLGIWSDARQGGRRGGIFYVVFPGSGNGQPRTLDEINSATEKAFQDWGGTAQANSCAANLVPNRPYWLPQ
jgi:Fungal chitosanase of glycosyl hydrolase group 75